MNIGKAPYELLYIGGQEGNGVVNFALHDANFHPYTAWYHYALLLYLIEYKVKENSVVVSLLGSGLGLGLGLVSGLGLGYGLVLGSVPGSGPVLGPESVSVSVPVSVSVSVLGSGYTSEE